MSTYFEAINDDQKVAINDTDKMLTLSRCAPVTDIAATSVSDYISDGFRGGPANQRAVYASKYSIVLEGSECIVAIRPPDEESVMCFTDQASGSVVDVVIIASSSATVRDEYAKKLYVYIFGEDRSVNNSGGLELYDKNGQVVYTSTDLLLNVRSAWTHTSALTYSVKQYDSYDLSSQLLKTDVDSLAIICNSRAAGLVFAMLGGTYPPGLIIYGYQRVSDAFYATPYIMGLNHKTQGTALYVNATYASHWTAYNQVLLIDVQHILNAYPDS